MVRHSVRMANRLKKLTVFTQLSVRRFTESYLLITKVNAV